MQRGLGPAVAFGGDWVCVQDYLPGLHLDIQAQRLLEPLPPGPVPQPYPVRRAMLDWDRMERRLWDALHSPTTGEATMFTDEEVRCVIRQERQEGVRQSFRTPVSFTLRCLWPGVLGDVSKRRRHAG